MEANPLAIKLGNYLYHHFFPIYKHIYPVFKRRQDAVEIAGMRRIVRSGSNVLDIGANIGFYTLLLADLVGGNGHVHAFEPEPINFEHLSGATTARGNITIVQKAISHQPEKLLMYKSRELNVDHRTYPVENSKDIVPVNAVSVDDYVAERFPVDFIKIDIQGYELHAFRGMERTVLANPELVIFSEFWPYGFRQCGTSASLVYDYLQSLNLQMWIPDHDNLYRLDRRALEGLKEAQAVYYNLILSRQPII
jgi:FkbM family methyltransferase